MKSVFSLLHPGDSQSPEHRLGFSVVHGLEKPAKNKKGQSYVPSTLLPAPPSSTQSFYFIVQGGCVCSSHRIPIPATGKEKGVSKGCFLPARTLPEVPHMTSASISLASTQSHIPVPRGQKVGGFVAEENGEIRRCGAAGSSIFLQCTYFVPCPGKTAGDKMQEAPTRNGQDPHSRGGDSKNGMAHALVGALGRATQ